MSGVRNKNVSVSEMKNVRKEIKKQLTIQSIGIKIRKNLSRSKKNLPKSRKIYQGQGKAIMTKKNIPKPREPHKGPNQRI